MANTELPITLEEQVKLMKKYVLPLYEEGNVLSISEKVISMCQNNCQNISENAN